MQIPMERKYLLNWISTPMALKTLHPLIRISTTSFFQATPTMQSCSMLPPPSGRTSNERSSWKPICIQKNPKAHSWLKLSALMENWDQMRCRGSRWRSSQWVTGLEQLKRGHSQQTDKDSPEKLETLLKNLSTFLKSNSKAVNTHNQKDQHNKRRSLLITRETEKLRPHKKCINHEALQETKQNLFFTGENKKIAKLKKEDYQ